MLHQEYMSKLRLDESEVLTRRAVFELGDEDLRRLSSLRPFAEKYTDGIVEEFYDLLLAHEVTRAYFPDEAAVRRVKQLQRRYFMVLFNGVCDLSYVADRLRVGIAHDRIGLSPKWYLAAASRYMRLIFDRMHREFPDPAELQACYASMEKLMNFDIALAMDAYVLSNSETLIRHQAAIRELSTPVIRVYDRVLLLPLIGAIDSVRAEQIMEAVLTQVIAEQARVIILDIAGVSVVDTKVAEHLLKTTAAVRLLGAQTILTGISAQVARTIVHLGVDITNMHTCNKLADGLELALEIVGRSISPIQVGQGGQAGPSGHVARGGGSQTS